MADFEVPEFAKKFVVIPGDMSEECILSDDIDISVHEDKEEAIELMQDRLEELAEDIGPDQSIDDYDKPRMFEVTLKEIKGEGSGPTQEPINNNPQGGECEVFMSKINVMSKIQGQSARATELADGATVGDLKKAFNASAHTAAVGGKQVGDDYVLSEGQYVTFAENNKGGVN